MAKQQRGQKGSALEAGNAVRVIVACLAVALIAFSGWSAAQYSNGNDPLAFLTGSGALQTTVEAAEDAAPSAADDEAQTIAASGTASASEGQGEVAVAEPEAQAEQTPAEAEQASAQASQASSAASQTSATDDAVQVTTTTTTSASQATAQTSPSQAQRPAAVRTIVVTLSIDGGEGASSAQIELNPGATAYDVLLAAGVSVSTIPNHFGSGTWVTSIAGLAEDAVHGWTYRVNGDMPNVMSDLYELRDGDTVLWQYV